MNLNNNYRECPTCHRKFFPLVNGAVELEAVLGDTVNAYSYCSEFCLNQKLENINSTNTKFDMDIYIVDKQRISTNPLKYRILFAVKDLKIYENK